VSVYLPKHFSIGDEAFAVEMVTENPFATLVSAGVDPWISHVPLLWDAEQGLLGHLAKANQHCRALEAGSSIAIFHGPHAYVSPTWYQTPGQVPTWNYAVVHAHGQPKILGDEASLDVLRRMVAAFDPGYVLDEDHLRRQSAAIVAFAMPVHRWDIKLKMSQNKPEADRLAVIDALRRQGGPAEQAVAAMMLDTGNSVR